MYAVAEPFGNRPPVPSDNRLIQSLERESDALAERGERGRATDAQRAASALRDALMLYRDAVDEVMRCGKRAKSPGATPDAGVAAELAQAVMRNRWLAVEEARESCARFLEAHR